MKLSSVNIAFAVVTTLLVTACNNRAPQAALTPVNSPLSSPIITGEATPAPPATPAPTAGQGQGASEATGKLLFTYDASGKFQIGVMNMADGKVTALTNSSGPGDADPSWAENGSAIFFITGRTRQNDFEIYRMNADGSDQKLVVTAPGSPAGNFAPELSRDGKTLVFQTNRDGNLEIYTANADGSGQKNISNSPTNDVTPSWSPDGTRIVFSSDRSGEYQLYTMNPDGSDVKLLFQHAGQSDIRPHYSPDGKLIVFGTQPTLGGDPQIAIINAGGTGFQGVSREPGMATQGSWMRNDTLVFSARADEFHTWQIYSIKLGSRVPIRLTHTEANYRNPSWTP
jgi:TolB protein